MTIGRGGKQQIAVLVYPGLSALELVGTVSVLSGLRPITLTAPLLTVRPKKLTRQERAAGATAS
jgi:hypothetical protein